MEMLLFSRLHGYKNQAKDEVHSIYVCVEL